VDPTRSDPHGIHRNGSIGAENKRHELTGSDGNRNGRQGNGREGMRAERKASDRSGSAAQEQKREERTRIDLDGNGSKGIERTVNGG
jgi:hypothetical protein